MGVALKSIHDSDFIHCDIKKENILAMSRNINPEIRIIDCGSFKATTSNYEVSSKVQLRDTKHYFAFESPSCNKYTEKTDVFQLGATFYTLIYDFTPFSTDITNVLYDPRESA